MRRYMFIITIVALGSISSYGDLMSTNIYTTTDRVVADNDNDDLGNNLFNESNGYNAVGDTATAELRTVLEFDSSAYKDQIAAATNITFFIKVKKQDGTPHDWQLFHMTSGNNGIVNAGDYQAAASQVGDTQGGSTAADTWVQIDVTSQVQADALNNDWSAFRLQVADPSGVPDDGVTDLVRFYESEDGLADAPYLMVQVPEASTVSLLTISTAGLSLLLLRNARGGSL